MSNTTASILFLLAFLGLAMALYAISDVQPGIRRRSLQNALYRLQNFVLWGYAVTAGIDAGLRAYYTVRKKYDVRLLNEKDFPPEPERKKPTVSAFENPEPRRAFFTLMGKP